VLILRTLFGFGMGAEWTAGATLAMESWPEKTRGLASGVLQGSWAVGYLLAAAASAYIVPRWGWRPLFLLAALPALMVLPIRFLVGFGVYYALSGVYPAMLAGRGLDASQIGGVLVVFNLGMLVGSIVCGVLAQRRGPLVAIALPALAMLPLLPLYVGAVPGALHLGAFLGGAVGVGFCGTVPAMLTGLFPTAVRGRAVGIVYHAGAFAAAFVPLVVTALAEHTALGLPGAIALVAGVLELALAGMFVAAPLVERSTTAWRSSHGSSSA
jgi:SHS family lactate transporter-like MFS transporter